MSQYNTLHFVAAQLEDGWMLQSEHVTKLQNGDWILDREELEELSELLQTRGKVNRQRHFSDNAHLSGSGGTTDEFRDRTIKRGSDLSARSISTNFFSSPTAPRATGLEGRAK